VYTVDIVDNNDGTYSASYVLPVGSAAAGPNAYQLELTLGGMVVVPSDQVPGAITALVAGTGAPNAMRSTVAGPGLGSVPTERRVCVVALINDDIGQPYVGGDVDVRGQLLRDGGTVYEVKEIKGVSRGDGSYELCYRVERVR
jgi:hypothetical protein